MQKYYDFKHRKMIRVVINYINYFIDNWLYYFIIYFVLLVNS